MTGGMGSGTTMEEAVSATAPGPDSRYLAGKNGDGAAEQTETEPFLVLFTR